MKHFLSTAILVTLTVAGTAFADTNATLMLESSRNGQTVAPGAIIDWTIRVSVPTGDNLGLAFVCVDLVQDDANPAFLDLPPGDAASIGTTMDDFSRPLGISNPGEGGATTGYVGVSRGAAGRRNLVQIGGGQNTFGAAGPAWLGQDITVDAGVGQGGSPQTILSGSFAAPGTPGTYTLKLQNGLANVLTAVNLAPRASSVAPATVGLSGAAFSFTVSPRLRGDLNCDGVVNFDDINAFVTALVNRQTYEAQYPTCFWLNGDINQDSVVSFDDINPFVTCLVAAECP